MLVCSLADDRALKSAIACSRIAE